MCDTDVSQLEDHPIGTFSTVMKEREREREKLLTCCVTYSHFLLWIPFQVDDGDGFTLPPTHPAAPPIGHDELRLSVTNGSRGWDLQTKEWTEEISRSQLYSRNRPSLQYMMKLQSTYSGASSLFPDVTSVGPPQVTLQDVSFGYVGTWGPDLQARGRRCLSGDYGSAKRNNTSKTTSHSASQWQLSPLRVTSHSYFCAHKWSKSLCRVTFNSLTAHFQFVL